MPLEVRSPVGFDRNAGFEPVEVPIEAAASALDLVSYLVRCFAHSRSSLTVAAV
jgi:hypothetical protein